MSKIIVAYDFSKHSDVAVQQAIEIACKDRAASLHFITVVDSNPDAVRRDLAERLRLMLQARHADVAIKIFVHARVGEPVHEVLEFAKELGADMIVLGSHGRGAMGRLLIGSVSEAVLHGAACPVLIARTKGYAYVPLDQEGAQVAAGRPLS
jgi:universal stress protein A